jgi:NAD(P)-dependent dehydrogenase (short-subunit alcohol dehydrogenase family)
MLLGGKTAVITGASSGIGRAIAQRFAEEGASVVVADVREAPRQGGTPTHEWIERETDQSAVYVDCDVTDPASFDPVVAAADELGGVDVMVNNAGIVGPQAPLVDVEPDAYRELMRVNVDGVYFGSQAAARAMLDHGRGGSIVNLSSVAGIVGYGGITPYSGAKGAVRLFSYALAAELGPENVRVNVVHPGVIETAMTTEDSPIVGTEEGEQLKPTLPLRRFGQPEDVANVVTFLASDLAAYVTAESVLVDGGMVNTA